MANQRYLASNNLVCNINDMLSHFYLNYRESINDCEQKNVKEFLNHIESKLVPTFYKTLPDKLQIYTCLACGEFSLWVDKSIVFPKMISVTQPNKDLNDAVKSLYLEAAKIVSDSPKGAAALLRLALQKLLRQVGKEGKNINNDIKELVEDGLSPKIQKALDLVRVVGNNAVHPGYIDFNDNPEIAEKLFQLINFIANELITKPKELEKLYDDLISEETQQHIADRDAR